MKVWCSCLFTFYLLVYILSIILFIQACILLCVCRWSVSTPRARRWSTSYKLAYYCVCAGGACQLPQPGGGVPHTSSHIIVCVQVERVNSQSLAVEYLRTDPSGRSPDTPIVLIKQGFEPPNFTGFFGFWDNDLWNVRTNNKTKGCNSYQYYILLVTLIIHTYSFWILESLEINE